MSYHIINEKINIEEFYNTPDEKSSGALVTFLGVVRKENHDKQVSYLEYEAHVALADKMIDEILQKAIGQLGLEKAQCVHRIGRVDVGEVAVIVTTASKHRKDAYKANQSIIHELKHKVPIWKKEYYSDGTYSWGKNCDCADSPEMENLLP